MGLTLSTEELNMIKVYDSNSRTGLIADMNLCLPYVNEPDVSALMRSVVMKLEQITDAEHAGINQPNLCEYTE